ncbi:hypothetical protein XA1311A_03560 [Xanthomonas arboricola]|nr:hypothetical protein XA1311A_03560 [Xanthomonas arboricola]CAE6698455.1 hypothetical protein XA1311A_03560 [Xanthomonas arboricola]
MHRSQPRTPTISRGPCPLTVAGPYAAWMPRKSLHGRTCGVSCEGGRARALQPSHRSFALETDAPTAFNHLSRQPKPLSPLERGRGEGTERSHTRVGVERLCPYPHPPLRGSFSRREKGSSSRWDLVTFKGGGIEFCERRSRASRQHATCSHACCDGRRRRRPSHCTLLEPHHFAALAFITALRLASRYCAGSRMPVVWHCPVV